MPKIKFLDSVKNKRKSLVFTHTEEDIVLNLPKESGTLVTDRLAEKKLNEANQGNQQNIIFILKPDITENNGGVTTSNWDEYFKIASYKTSAGFLGKHTGTEWIAYSDSNLTTLVDRSSGNILHKDKWKPNTNTPNLDLYVRYRFASNNIYSPWSNSIHVVTAPGGISPFDVSVEENTLTPLCSVSSFNAYGNASGANHVSTSWVVYEANGESLGAKVIESLKDTTNKMNFRIPNGKLRADKEYYLQVTLHTDNSNYPNSKAYVRKFTTGSAYIERPVLKYEATDNGRHIIKASDFRCSDSSQSLVSAVWKLYNANNNTLINSVTNTSKEYDITIFVDSKKKYYVTLVYKSNELTSPEGKCTFTVKGSKADEITASFDTSTDPTTIKLPILKLSKFYVPSETDSIKSMAYKSIHKDHSIEDQHGWFMGKYNVPMEHTLTRDEYRALLDLEKEWDNSPLKLKAYIIGNKYNSDIFEATFTPDISLNYKVVKYGESWDDFKIQIVKDDSLNPSNPTPGWIGFDRFYIYGDKITTPIDSGFHYHSEHTPIVAIPNNGYEYNKDYHFTFKIYNSVGVRTIEYTVKMEGGKITDPDMAIEAKHAYGDYVNMKVKGTEYAYSRPIDSTNGLKEIKLTIQDTSDNNKVVYEQIQTVADKGPSVYNFDINYDKNHLDKSLKHNTKYLISIEYKNVRGERSKRVTKEFTTPERKKVILPSDKPYVDYGVTTVWGDGTPTVSYVELRAYYYIYSYFSNGILDKVTFRIKKENGDLIKEHIVTIDDYIAGKTDIKVDEFTKIKNYYSVNYNWNDLIRDQWYTNHTMYQNPYFEVGGVYYLEVEYTYENITSKVSKLFIITQNYGAGNKFPNRKDQILKINPIDNLRLRREFFVMLEIDNPNIASGTILNNQQISAIISKDLTFSSPHVKLENATISTGTPGTGLYFMHIITNFRDPSKSKVIVNTFDNPREDPKFIEGYNNFPELKEASSTILTYNDVKPAIYVTYENNKWYIVFKYLFFPRNIERNPNFIYPFVYGRFSYTFANQTYFYFNYKYKDEPELYKSEVALNSSGGSTETTDIPVWWLNPVEIKRKNITGERYTTKYVTTDKFIENEIELSNVSSDNYKVLLFPEGNNHPYHGYGPKEGKLLPYPTPYLEYLPVDGCKLILALGSGNLARGKLAPEDNLLVQPNPKNGVHFKIYKIEANGTETELPNILDAFSVGILEPNTTIDTEFYGSWTKPVNKRTVLEHGQLYKVKIWFVPYNNDNMARQFYIEKHFIGYKKEVVPTLPTTITKPEVSLNIHSKNGDGIVTGLSGAITNTINVTGKSGITHTKTKWVLKDENGVELWSETDINLKNIFLNRQSLVNKFMPDTTWSLEAIAIASDNTESELGKGIVYNKANADMFYKPEFISNKIESHIKWRTIQTWRVKIRKPGTLMSGTKIMPSKIRDFCNIVKYVYGDVVANKYPIDIIHWYTRSSLRRSGIGIHWVGPDIILNASARQDSDANYNYIEAPFDIEILDLNNVSDTVVAAIRNNVKQVKIYPNYNELLNMYVKFIDNTWYLYFEVGLPGIGTAADLNLPFTVRPNANYDACLMINVKYIPSQYGTGNTGWTVNDGWQYTVNPVNKYMEGITCEFRTTGITKGFGISSDNRPSPELSSISSAGMDIKYVENGISKTMPYGPDKLEYFFATKTDLYLEIDPEPFMNLDHGNLDPLPNNKDTVINYNNDTLGLQLEIWNYDLATKKATTMVPNVKQSFKPHLTAPDGMLGIEYPEPNDSVKLVHNQPYLIKMWFRPFNNSHFKNFCYVEKVMVAYDKTKAVSPIINLIQNTGRYIVDSQHSDENGGFYASYIYIPNNSTIGSVLGSMYWVAPYTNDWEYVGGDGSTYPYDDGSVYGDYGYAIQYYSYFPGGIGHQFNYGSTHKIKIIDKQGVTKLYKFSIGNFVRVVRGDPEYGKEYTINIEEISS